MDTKVYKTKNHLVIKVPLITYRCNPYDDRALNEEMPNIIALIEDDFNMGFCYRIDMSYKGKEDQYSDYFFKWQGPKKEFENLCRNIMISIIYCSNK